MSQRIARTQKTVLNAPLEANSLSVSLRQFLDTQGNPLSMENFGEFGVIVLKQGNIGEMVKFVDIQQLENGSAVLTIADDGRDISPVFPFEGSDSGKDFQQNTEVIVSNDPLTISQFGNVNNENTWRKLNSFEITPKSFGGEPLEDEDLVTRAFAIGLLTDGDVTTNAIIINGVAGEELAKGDVVYLDDDGKWKKVRSDKIVDYQIKPLGISQNAAQADQQIVGGVCIFGVDETQTGMTPNVDYYATTTAGKISQAYTQFRVGRSLTETKLLFQPKVLKQKRVISLSNSSNPVYNTNDVDVIRLTAQTSSISSMSGNISGSPAVWDLFVVEIRAARNISISWGSKFDNGSVYNLPRNMNSGETYRVLVQWNGEKWICIGIA